MTPMVERALLAASIGLPFAAALVLAIGGWLARPWPERFVHGVATWTLGLVFLSTATLGIALVLRGGHALDWSIPGWFGVLDYHFPLALSADLLSVPTAAFAAGLLVLTAKFSSGYLHREPGFRRYYLLLCLFGGAFELAVLAGSLDFLLFGWELVGFTSVLLIAFFHERHAPVSHGLRTFVVYRICDVGLLSAAVWLHHSVGAAHAHSGALPWWGVEVPTRTADAVLVGLLLIWASLGKGGQIPFGGWLPRAMEGPTPSSAIFYGALSVHLGPYLLLRAAPLLDAEPLLAGLVVAIGLGTAIHGTLVGRVQSDIKCALAYAVMTQVGVIMMEIGLGFRLLAVVHVLGHATLRCLQFLRAPSVLVDRAEDEMRAGAALHRRVGALERRLPRPLRLWLYRGALERGFLDALLRDYVLGPLLRWSAQLDQGSEALHDALFGRRVPSDSSTPIEGESEVLP